MINAREFRGFRLTVSDKIKILELLKSCAGISYKEIQVDGVEYYSVLAQIRDYQKQGFTTNNEGVLGITEHGVEYLNKLLKSNTTK